MATTSPQHGDAGAADRRLDRRAALLEAALQLVDEDPMGVPTASAICERAGVAERHFYESFAHRDVLLLEVLDSIGVELTDAVATGLELDTDAVEERARAAINGFVDVYVDDPRKGRFLLVSSIAIPALRARRQALFASFARMVSERTHHLYGDRAWPPPHDRMESALFVGGLAELMTGWLTGAIEATREEVVDAATRHYLATAHR